VLARFASLYPSHGFSGQHQEKVGSTTGVKTPPRLQSIISSNHFLLLLLRFFSTFLSIDVDFTPGTTRPLCNGFKRRTLGNSFLLSVLSIFALA
jgi:hypothetical protein